MPEVCRFAALHYEQAECLPPTRCFMDRGAARCLLLSIRSCRTGSACGIESCIAGRPWPPTIGTISLKFRCENYQPFTRISPSSGLARLCPDLTSVCQLVEGSKSQNGEKSNQG